MTDNAPSVELQNFVRGYTAGWRDAIAAIRRELVKPDKPDGWLDHVLESMGTRASENPGIHRIGSARHDRDLLRQRQVQSIARP
jgi:hypothetical protein